MASNYRPLSHAEISQLEEQGCTCSNWRQITVAETFNAKSVRNTHLSGTVKIGAQQKTFSFYGGLERPAGIGNAAICNCTIAADVYINGINNYIANYDIAEGVIIENVDLLAVEGQSAFGNGVSVSVLNEAGGREVILYNGLTAQIAYLLAMYRDREKMIACLEKMIGQYADSVQFSRGQIGPGATITNSGTIKNVMIGPAARVEGAVRLANGSVNSTEAAPVTIGAGVVAEDFIISSGAKITDGVVLTQCFVGQATSLGRQFSAENSAFFANCEGFHGEACSWLAGPYSVTHHKSSLLIALLTSFYNAGSGSNQSNHMYKLGPVHQGILERGSKTGSFSYLFWPARIGAFSAVIGKHYARFDSSDLPFSYILESKGKSVLAPGVNLATVGTVRDAAKWPQRDKRQDPVKLDLITFQAMSPFTVQKMIRGRDLLMQLRRDAGEKGEPLRYGELHLDFGALERGIAAYQMGIDKYLGDVLVKRLQENAVADPQQLASLMNAPISQGQGEWIDLLGMLAPQEAVEEVLAEVEAETSGNVDQLAQALRKVHEQYANYEWAWVTEQLERILGKEAREFTADDVGQVITRWQEASRQLNDMILKDAAKEFSDTARMGYGIDGDEKAQGADFAAVRGTCKGNSFIVGVEKNSVETAAVAEDILARIRQGSQPS